MVTAGELVSIAELARRVGLARQVVHRHVRRLVEDGVLEVRRGPGGRVLVDEAAYRRARAAMRDVSRDLGSEVAADQPRDPVDAYAGPDTEMCVGGAAALAPSADAPAAGTAYREARAARERVELELKRLQLMQRRGELRPVEDIEAAAMDAGRAIARRLDQLIQSADEITTAARKRGADGVREMLAGLVRDVRRGVAEDLAALSSRPDDGDDEAGADDGAD